MAVTVTLKTLQQQTFKIRMEPHETVRAGGARGGGLCGAERSGPEVGWVGEWGGRNAAHPEASPPTSRCGR